MKEKDLARIFCAHSNEMCPERSASDANPPSYPHEDQSLSPALLWADTESSSHGSSNRRTLSIKP